jgi:two-component SAPR family response regulator
MSGKLILLIDDDPLSNIFNTMMIKKNHPGEEVLAITNANDAINYLKDDNRKVPELIFLDLNMPIMNGWDFLEEYKKLDLKINIVLVTSSNDSDDISRSKGYKEVKHYLVKPITSDSLKKAVALMDIP